jgi:hypothetical protein
MSLFRLLLCGRVGPGRQLLRPRRAWPWRWPTLGLNLVETFLAFIQSDRDQRARLLDIAGASGFVAEIADELADPHFDSGSIYLATVPK